MEGRSCQVLSAVIWFVRTGSVCCSMSLNFKFDFFQSGSDVSGFYTCIRGFYANLVFRIVVLCEKGVISCFLV